VANCVEFHFAWGSHLRTPASLESALELQFISTPIEIPERSSIIRPFRYLDDMLQCSPAVAGLDFTSNKSTEKLATWCPNKHVSIGPLVDLLIPIASDRITGGSAETLTGEIFAPAPWFNDGSFDGEEQPFLQLE
jgi:hypothetical protein